MRGFSSWKLSAIPDSVRYEPGPAEIFRGCYRDVNQAPCYLRIRDGWVDGEACYGLSYYVFTAYNGAYPTPIGKCGSHEGDWEHVTIYVSKKTGALHSVFYSCHGESDGQLRLAKDAQGVSNPEIELVDRDNDGLSHVVAYMAVNGHGMYPKAGSYSRLYGFGTDRTEKGVLWNGPLTILPESYDVQSIDGNPSLFWMAYWGVWGCPEESGKSHHTGGTIREEGGNPEAPLRQKRWHFYEWEVERRHKDVLKKGPDPRHSA